MIFKKLNPIEVFKTLKSNIEDLLLYKKYKNIIFELGREGKLKEIGFSVDSDANLYIGIDLNPELLLYSETSTETVELKMISEKIKKYTDFLTKEGILDSVMVEYDRVKTDAHYGYILQIKYNFKKYKKLDLIYSISYFSILCLLFVSILIAIFNSFA